MIWNIIDFLNVDIIHFITLDVATLSHIIFIYVCFIKCIEVIKCVKLEDTYYFYV